MIYKLFIKNKDNEKFKEFIKLVEEDASRPSGVWELVESMSNTGACESYCNDRIMWLGWQLEKNGISVAWEQVEE